jgi:ATP-dependent exoDNAse (exonuclease V) alpha subunit
MQGFVRALYKKRNSNRMDFEFDEKMYPGIKYDKRFFGQEKPDFKYSDQDSPSPFDYAYCATAHKCQGDEWDKVMVIEQKSGLWNHRRWAYTSASRAMEQLIWVS